MIHMLDTYFQGAMYRLKGDDEGATATEYIVLLVFIALAIIVGANALGLAINGAFQGGATRVTDGPGAG